MRIAGRGMIGVPGMAARAFGTVSEAKANVLMISQSSSEQSICFVIPRLLQIQLSRPFWRNFLWNWNGDSLIALKASPTL